MQTLRFKGKGWSCQPWERFNSSASFLCLLGEQVIRPLNKKVFKKGHQLEEDSFQALVSECERSMNGVSGWTSSKKMVLYFKRVFIREKDSHCHLERLLYMFPKASLTPTFDITLVSNTSFNHMLFRVLTILILFTCCSSLTTIADPGVSLLQAGCRWTSSRRRPRAWPTARRPRATRSARAAGNTSLKGQSNACWNSYCIVNSFQKKSVTYFTPK